MEQEIEESVVLCRMIMDLLEQDVVTLSKSLQGDILTAYKRVVQAEIDSMQEVQRALLRAMK